MLAIAVPATSRFWDVLDQTESTLDIYWTEVQPWSVLPDDTERAVRARLGQERLTPVAECRFAGLPLVGVASHVRSVCRGI